MTEITSRQHPVVKQFREAAHGGSLMLLDGWHLIAEALGADVIASCEERKLTPRKNATGTTTRHLVAKNHMHAGSTY